MTEEDKEIYLGAFRDLFTKGKLNNDEELLSSAFEMFEIIVRDDEREVCAQIAETHNGKRIAAKLREGFIIEQV